MIYTVTFNPSLDYIVGVDEFKTGKVNRTAEELILPGDRKSTRLNSSHLARSRMPSSA